MEYYFPHLEKSYTKIISITKMEFDILNEIISDTIGEFLRPSSRSTIQDSQSPLIRNKPIQQSAPAISSFKIDSKMMLSSCINFFRKKRN